MIKVEILKSIVGNERANELTKNANESTAKRLLCKEAAKVLSTAGLTPSEISSAIGLSEGRVRFLLKES